MNELGVDSTPFDADAGVHVLRTAQLKKPFNDALGHLTDSHPDLMLQLRGEVWPLFARTLVGAAIGAASTEPESDSAEIG